MVTVGKKLQILSSRNFSAYICACVSVYRYIYTHSHTHTHRYIYIYLLTCSQIRPAETPFFWSLTSVVIGLTRIFLPATFPINQILYQNTALQLCRVCYTQIRVRETEVWLGYRTRAGLIKMQAYTLFIINKCFKVTVLYFSTCAVFIRVEETHFTSQWPSFPGGRAPYRYA